MVRPRMDEDVRKAEVLTLRMTAVQIEYLDAMATLIAKTSGFPTSRTAVAVRLIELGKAALEKQYPARKK